MTIYNIHQSNDEWIVLKSGGLVEWPFSTKGAALFHAMQLASINRPATIYLFEGETFIAKRFLKLGGPSYFDYPLLARFWLPESAISF